MATVKIHDYTRPTDRKYSYTNIDGAPCTTSPVDAKNSTLVWGIGVEGSRGRGRSKEEMNRRYLGRGDMRECERGNGNG